MPSMIQAGPPLLWCPHWQQGRTTHLQHLLVIELSEDSACDLIGFQGHPVYKRGILNLVWMGFLAIIPGTERE